MNQSISEEFERAFPDLPKAREGSEPLKWKSISSARVRDIHEFYQSKISQAITAEKEKPMGVSQWKEHGVKNGYWDYFKEQVVTAERKELRELLIEADSKLSLLRHRGGIRWGAVGMCESREVDAVIGRLRSKYESLLEEK